MTGDLNMMLSEKARDFTRKVDVVIMNESLLESRVSISIFFTFHRSSTAVTSLRVSALKMSRRLKSWGIKAPSLSIMNT